MNHHHQSPVCPDCVQEFDTQQHFPKIIPKCGHSICKECLIKRINNSSLHCPFDHTDFGSSFNNIDDFSADYHILHILGAKYNLVSHVCELHNQKQDMICLEDQKLICSQCALSGDHVGHEVHPLSAFKAISEQKKGQLTRISEKIKGNVSSFYDSLDDKIEIMKESVKEKFDLVRFVLEKHETKIMSDIEKIYAGERAKFKQLTSGVLCLESEIKNKLIELNCMIISPEIRKLVGQDFGHLEIQADELLISIGEQSEKISNLQAKIDLAKEMSIFEPLNEEVAKLTALDIKTMKFKREQLRQYLGNFAYPLVCKLVGPKFAPKVTGMLVDLAVLEVVEILEIITSEKELKERVDEAMELIKAEGMLG